MGSGTELLNIAISLLAFSLTQPFGKETGSCFQDGLLLPTSSEAPLPNTQEAELPSKFKITTSKPRKDIDIVRKAWRLLTLCQNRLHFVRVPVEVTAPPVRLSDQAVSGGSDNSPSIKQEKEPSHETPSQITNSSSLTVY